MFHSAIVLLIIRASRLPIILSTPMKEPLVLLLLPHKALVSPDVSTPRNPADQRRSGTSRSRAPKSEAATNDAITVAPESPKMDLEKEAKLAAQNAIANAGKENGYRNLSALTPE
jgi:hypothetical protein